MYCNVVAVRVPWPYALHGSGKKSTISPLKTGFVGEKPGILRTENMLMLDTHTGTNFSYMKNLLTKLGESREISLLKMFK